MEGTQMEGAGDDWGIDPEKGCDNMDHLPGETTDTSSSGKEERKGRVVSLLIELVALLKLFMFSAERKDPGEQWRETKKISMLAIAILSINAAVMTTTQVTDRGFAQAVLILTALSFVLAMILIILPIAKPAPSMNNIKRFVVVCAGIITACSFLLYAADKMGPMAPSSVAAISVSGLFVLLLTILFLTRLAAPLTET